MQTRRDQLHAYRFQNRRALAALVTGEPNVLEPPMRRLTVITVSGIMIAILIAAGFALVGVFRPATGDKWKQAGAIIVERETGARYVLLDDDALHPVLNYSSAVLAVGTNQDAHVVLVDRSDLKNAHRGATIGIDGIPDSLPSAANLVTTPWSVCSREQPGQATKLQARVSVLAGSDAGARAVPSGTGVLVRDATTGARYLLLRGQRLLVSSDAVATSMGLPSTSDVAVGTAFLDGVPAGPALRAPEVPDAGALAPIGGQPALVGQLLHTSDNNQYFLRLADGVAELDPLQTALLRTLPLGANHQPKNTIETTASAVLSVPGSQRDWAAVAAQLKGLPTQVPTVSPAPSQAGAVCAVYRGSAAQPTFGTPPSKLPAYSPNGVAETERSRRGLADDVILPPGRAALVKSRDGSATVFVIADPGKRFAVSSNDVLKGFGYAGVNPTPLPVELLPLIPVGPALDVAAARRPVSG